MSAACSSECPENPAPCRTERGGASGKEPSLRDWLIATRPWSFTASSIPIFLGAALAWNQGHVDIPLFVLTLIGAVLIHAGTNLFNTLGDYLSGVDTPASSATCPQLTSGAMRPQSMRRAAWGCFALAMIPGLILVLNAGWPILAFGCIGLAGGYAYTMGPRPFKYAGFGSTAVAVLMGPCMVVPAWFIQGGGAPLTPILASLPVAFLVSAILHANDLRDLPHDAQSGIKTLALGLGLAGGLRVYAALLSGAYLSLLGLVLTGLAPFSALLAFVTLPLAVRALRGAFAGETLAPLEGQSAQLHFLFGALYVLGLLLHLLLRHFGLGGI